jgi:ubiquinone/menaquinone biosynthesis C-methylase UbiE
VLNADLIDSAQVLIEGSGYNEPGYAERYDEFRPQAPTVVVDILTRVGGVKRPRLVVDVGCGTGLSTRLWAAHADRVIGIEPNPHMVRVARQRGWTAANVSYREGFGHDMRLPDGCADVVTCAQSLHWMEPGPTFAEVVRILRPEGVFAAYDYDYEITPITYWEVGLALQRFHEAVKRIRVPDEERVPEAAIHRWDKDGHLERMRASGHFRYVREVGFLHQSTGDVERLLNTQRAISGVHRLLVRRVPEVIEALDTLRRAVHEAVGEKQMAWYLSYRLWLGVR